MKSVNSFTLFLSCMPLAFSSPLSSRAIPLSKCEDIIFTASATAQNRVANYPPVDFTDPAQVGKFLRQPIIPHKVSGTQKIYGQYCWPMFNPRPGALQILIPGNSYDHTYFNGFDARPIQSNSYSWTSYALSKGYPTLSLDRLGSGKSDHPDPIDVLQAPYQWELIHDIVRQIRAGKVKEIARPQQVVYVGHSFGAILGTQLSAQHPEDFDAMIHTGFAIPKEDQFALPGQLANIYLQASTYDPQRFPPDVFVPGCLVATSKDGRASTFFSDKADFDPSVYETDFKLKETLSLGEALTQRPLEPSFKYDKPVFVLTGQQDAVFCGNGSRELEIPDCGSGPQSQLAAVKALYPAVPAERFDTFTQPKAGHCHQLHYSGSEGFGKVHAWLADQGF